MEQRRETVPRRAFKGTENFRNSSKWWFWVVDVVGSAALASLTTAFTINTIPNWLVGVLTFFVFVFGMVLIYGIIYLVHLILLLKMPIREKIREYLRRLRILWTTRKLPHVTGKNLNICFKSEVPTITSLNTKLGNLTKRLENLEKNKLNNNQSGDKDKTIAP